MRSYYSLFILIILTGACGSSDSEVKDPVTGLIEDTIVVDETNREFILYVPESYKQSDSYPLLLTFHGYTGTATNIMNYSGYNAIADSSGFIVVYPKGSLLNGNTHWNVGGWTLASRADDIKFTNLLIDHISDVYNIDQDRIYANGMSNGGYMSLMLACNQDNRFAAVASVTGAMTPQMLQNCAPENPIPVLQFHADQDQTVPYSGNDIWTISIPEVLSFWVNHNGASETYQSTVLPDIDTEDGSTVEVHLYEAMDTYAPVIHYYVIGGGHDWPGAWGNQDINASSIIWEFFDQYDRNGIR